VFRGFHDYVFVKSCYRGREVGSRWQRRHDTNTRLSNKIKIQ